MKAGILRRLAVVGAAAAAVVALGAVPAQAATATLSIPFVNCENSQGTIFDYYMRVDVTLSGTYGYGGHIIVRIWGDDSFSDDLLLGPVRWDFGPFASRVFVDLCVNSSTLDEDIGEDEVYAGVRVFNSNGVQTEVVESNRLEDNF